MRTQMQRTARGPSTTVLSVLLSAGLTATAAAQQRQGWNVVEMRQGALTLMPQQVPLGEVTNVRGEATEKPALTLVFAAPAGSEAMWNAAPFLAELQRRYGKRGFEALLLLDRPPDERALETLDKGFRIGHLGNRLPAGRCLLVDGEGKVVCSARLRSGVTQWIEQLLDGGTFPTKSLQLERLRIEALGEIEDHETQTLSQQAKLLREFNPRNPEGWLFDLIVAVERKADLQVANDVAQRAFAALRGDSAAIARFVEKLLQTEPNDPGLLQKSLMALVSIAPAAENDLPLQLQYLRVLSALGREREADLLVARLRGLVERRSAARADLAEALAFGKLAPRFATVARPLIEGLRAKQPADKLLQQIHYNVLVQCCDDAKAAAKIVDHVTRSASSVNDDAWYLMTREPGRGRFNRLAMAMCERLITAGDLSGAYMDTIGLALFYDGQYERAIEMQTRAAASSNQNPSYVRRLERFRKIAAHRRAVDERSKKDPRERR